MPDWLAILKAYVDTLETIVGTEGGVALANKLTAARATLLDRLSLIAAGGANELTAARAGYLDNINQAGLLQVTAARAALLDQITALRLAELDAANLPADIDTLLTRLPAVLSAARIGYLDNINQAGLLQVTAARAALLDQITALRLAELDAANIPATTDAIKVQTDKLAGAAPSVGTATENWNTAEANVVSIGANDIKNKLHSLLLSIHNLVGTVVTVRMYMEVNGAERKVYEQAFDATSDPPGLWIVNGTIGIHEVLRVSLQSNNAADNAKAVHYDYMLEAM